MIGLGLGVGLSRRRVAGPGGGPSYPTPPAGYDLFTYLGDSLGMGRSNPEASRDPVLDAPVANTVQYVNWSGQGDYQQLRYDTSPLWSSDDATERVSPMEAMLRRYQVNTAAWSRGGGMVMTSEGGTALLNDSVTSDWDPATPGSKLVNSKNAHNAGYALLRAAHPQSRLRGIIIDLNSNGNSASYTATDNRNAWLALIDYVRANYNGVTAETPIIIGGPCNGGTGGDAYRADIDFVATQRSGVTVVHPPFPTASGDNLHPTMAENRTWGANIANAIYAAPEYAVVEDFSIASVNGAALATDYSSAAMTVMVGYGVGVTASIGGGTYSVNGGAFTSSPSTVYWGDDIVVKLASSGSASTTTTATLTVGTKSAPFNVTTVTPLIAFAAPASVYFDNGSARFAGDGVVMETV